MALCSSTHLTAGQDDTDNLSLEEDIFDQDICGVFCTCDVCLEHYMDSDEASETQASELTADFDQDEEEVMSSLSSSSSPCCSRSVSCSSTDTLSLCRS